MVEETAGEAPDRFAAFDRWVQEVRDPARGSSEGLRVASVCHGKATAEYEIAPLPSGRYAIRMSCTYHCGNGSGRSIPWTEFQTREECVDHFLDVARRHFQPECVASNCNDIQRDARREMLQLLKGGLFGFVEPEPESTASSG